MQGKETLPLRVYHGTDATSGESIRRGGLDRDRWRSAAGTTGVDEKGFSVTTNRATAEGWARHRAGERGGPPDGSVLEAEADLLPLRPGEPGAWADPEELYIAPEDFKQVGPGVFS
jgi:hypothetical protein